VELEKTPARKGDASKHLASDDDVGKKEDGEFQQNETGSLDQLTYGIKEEGVVSFTSSTVSWHENGADDAAILFGEPKFQRRKRDSTYILSCKQHKES
jgi:hypothetical protein